MTTEFLRQQFPQWFYYRCNSCQRVVTAVILERGTTAFSMACNALPGQHRVCVGTLYAHHEKRTQWPDQAKVDPAIEFYRPRGELAMRQMKKQAPALHKYVMDGGLVFRACTDTSPKWERPLPDDFHELPIDG